uniref:nucleoporin NUP159-like n=1 Tax=Oncorhynchus gorbuscha TaxID=8017 RepID=UPI001EAF25AA|nr:nucleoporin NUP159-like [Oncorhynchus gorbuscha]
MRSSSRTFAPPLRPRRIDTSRRTTTVAEPKPHGPVSQREDKNMNTISSPRRATKATPESSRTRVGVQPRAPLGQSRLGLQRNTAPLSTTKPKSVRAAAVSKCAPRPAPLPHLDPNCNEPSLPCLCCDGHSPQDNNSLFNHNHNNNNTISIRQQLKLQPPPPPPLLPQRQEGTGGKTKTQASPSQPQPQVLAPACPPNALELEKGKIDKENADVNKNTDVVIDNKKETEEEEENSVEVDDEEEGDDDDDTLVPSCCDCPPSLLDLSLTSSTSSTSISSCSDLESDCADLSTALSSSGHKWNADLSISQDHIHVPERYPASRSPPVLLLNPKPPLCLSLPFLPPTRLLPRRGLPLRPRLPLLLLRLPGGQRSDRLRVRGHQTRPPGLTGVSGRLWKDGAL